MILFGIREFFAFAVSLFGLYIIFLSLTFVNNGFFIESSVCAGLGIMVLRAGLYTFRVSSAARVLLEEVKRQKEEASQK